MNADQAPPSHEERWMIEVVARHGPSPTDPEQVVAQLLRDTGIYFCPDMVAAVMADMGAAP